MTTGARFSGAKGGAALLLACGLFLAGCSTAEAPDSAESAPSFSDLKVVPGAAKLDVATEAITLPVDQYGMSVLESRIIDYAVLLQQKGCMAEKGVDFPVVKPFNSFDDPPGGDYEGGPTPNHIWGLWNLETAAKWGYEDPPNELQERMMAANATPLSAEGEKAASSCREEVSAASSVGVDKLFGDDTSITYRAQFHTLPEDTPAGKEVYASWAACLAKDGLKPAEDNPNIPAGALEMGREDQINAAIKDVTCKQETGMIQQLADIEAAYQAVYVAKNEAALVAWRAKIQDMVDESEDIIRAREG